MSRFLIERDEWWPVLGLFESEDGIEIPDDVVDRCRRAEEEFVAVQELLAPYENQSNRERQEKRRADLEAQGYAFFGDLVFPPKAKT